MKRINIMGLYKQAKTAEPAEPLMFNKSLVSSLPEITDEAGNVIDCDFISYYVDNMALFDRYIKYKHGSKIYKYYDDEFETALAAWHDQIEAIMFANMEEFAGKYAMELIKNKIVLNNRIYKKDTLGEQIDHHEYGEKHSSATMGERNGESHSYNKAYDSAELTETAKGTSKSEEATDETTADAYEDVITKEETINEYETTDNHSYYDKLRSIPAFDSIMKSILDKIIIESGVSYEY